MRSTEQSISISCRMKPALLQAIQVRKKPTASPDSIRRFATRRNGAPPIEKRKGRGTNRQRPALRASVVARRRRLRVRTSRRRRLQVLRLQRLRLKVPRLRMRRLQMPRLRKRLLPIQLAVRIGVSNGNPSDHNHANNQANYLPFHNFPFKKNSFQTLRVNVPDTQVKRKA